MRFTLSITQCAFIWPRASADRYRVKVHVAYQGSDHNLGTGHQQFAPVDASPIATTGSAWRHVVDIDRRRSDPIIEVRAELWKWGSAVQLEEVVHRWSSEMFYDTLDITGDKLRVRLHCDAAGPPPPMVIYARRSGERSGTPPQIIAGPRVNAFVHLDPVMPWAARERVVYPAWTQAPGSARHSHPMETPPCSLNPSVVPAWTEPGAPPEAWLNRWKARVHLTRVYARGALAPSELNWSHETISGTPNLTLLDPHVGYSAEAYARGEGEGRITVSRGNGPPLARLRVLARRPVTLATQVMVVMPREPATSVAETATMRGVTERVFNEALGVANQFLRQVAVQLAPPTFRRTRGVSIGVNLGILDEEARSIGTPNTVTFVVLHSGIEPDATGQLVPSTALGKTSGVPRTRAPTTNPPECPNPEIACFSSPRRGFVDAGTPSSSLVPPTGVPPDEPAESQTLAVLWGEENANPVIYLFQVVQGLNGTTTGVTGDTIAHEMGHVFNLAHRGEDGFPFLGTQNLMMPSARSRDANDLDIAQAKVIWHSPLLRR